MTLWYLTRAHSLFVSLCLHVCFFIRLSPLSYSCFPLLHSLFSPLLFSRHYLRSPFPGTCLSSLFSLPLSSSSNISAHQAYSFFHYYFISSFWHSGNNRQRSLLVSSLFSLSSSSLLSLALLGSSEQQRAVKLISWPEQTKPKPHSPSSICCYVSALWIGSFQAWSLEE